ncbi:MAG: Glu-tRNA(Gln) amidotransferase subunit GatD [Candidatus Aenigmarchaeota archaeon]|nr:Glu-tRNA(Gln) amidotransferase subunit GatD [Candidatus Aenigmarchaeota archaeon]MDW8160309.1 Glu-tRNA(Gln) amidotransferase subunit GatD [Candidatus Aenigmarchaeota archaeon]
MDVYSNLKKKGISVGDLIEVSGLKGILMPRTDFSHEDVVVIKLSNGYNVGIKVEDLEKIKLVEKLENATGERREVEEEFDKNKPIVSLIACGGTIASKVEYRTGAVYPSYSPQEILNFVPEVREIANIRVKKVFEIFSEDIQPEHWIKLAEEVVKEIESGVDGVVITHGTDTMHYTSAALSFMLRNLPVPVVLVGAQRSSDRPSSDARLNLLSAVLFAAKGEIAEVVVCMHGSMSDEYCLIHRGTRVRKLHTSRRDAFQSVNSKPLAKVDCFEKKIEYLVEEYRRRDKNRKVELDKKINPRVGVFYYHPGASVEHLKEMKKHYDGLVIAATGLGHVGVNPYKDVFSKNFLPAIKDLIDSGIPVVFAPQTIFGRLDMDVYLTGRLLQKVGVIGNGCDWTIETALVKLMFVLGHTKNMEEIKRMMQENLVGEFGERSES